MCDGAPLGGAVRLPESLCKAAGAVGTRDAWLVAVSVVVLCATTVVLWQRIHTQREETPFAAKAAARKVVLLGAEEAGKTSVFLHMTMGVAPHTVATQRVCAGTGKVGGHQLDVVDVPGHPRLRTQGREHILSADLLVFCIDASVASRGGSESATAAAALSTLKRTDLQEALVDSVDYLHDVLRMLASKAGPPPALLLLFTRIDRSPLFADKALLSDTKRRWQLMMRCRRGVESVLLARRMSRGLHAQGRVMMGDIDEVQGGAAGLLARVRSVLARVPLLHGLVSTQEPTAPTAAEWHPTRLGHNVRAGEGHKQSDEFVHDYLVSARGGAPDAPLDHLRADVVEGGRASLALSSIDVSGWAPSAATDLEEVVAFCGGRSGRA